LMLYTTISKPAPRAYPPSADSAALESRWYIGHTNQKLARRLILQPLQPKGGGHLACAISIAQMVSTYLFPYFK